MINITIKNKLCWGYGFKSLHVRKDGSAITGSPIPGGNMAALSSTLTKGTGVSIELEVDKPAFLRCYPPPIVKTAPGVIVEMNPHGKGRKWTLTFTKGASETAKLEKAMSDQEQEGDQKQKKAAAMTVLAVEEEDTEVTVGKDEPDTTNSMVFSAVLGGLSIGLLTGPYLQDMSQMVWLGLSAVSLIGSAVTFYIARKSANPDQIQQQEK